MKHDDAVYIAALIDGEGSILLTRNKPNEHRHPAITVPSCTQAFMSYLQNTVGGRVSTKRTYKRGHSKSWVWALKSTAVLAVLKAVLPYMKEPEKIRRATLLLKLYNVVTSRNGKYSKEALRYKQHFERRFFQSSKKVTHV